MNAYYVYILACSDGSFYTGVTNNLALRIAEHEAGIDPQCYTYKRRPLELVWNADFVDIRDAIVVEKQIKKWSRAKKVALIQNDLKLLSKLAENPLFRNLSSIRFACHGEYSRTMTSMSKANAVIPRLYSG